VFVFCNERVFVFLVAIALAGCLPEKANDLADCQTEADHFYQTYQALLEPS
jgi:hypothetical protein